MIAPDYMPAGKQAYQSTELRQTATVQAVSQLCAEQDPATLTTARIADEVGLSKVALLAGIAFVMIMVKLKQPPERVEA